MEVKIHESWKAVLQNEFDAEYFEQLTEFVKAQYQSTTVYPPATKIFAAFDNCNFDDIKVVILGQDPYHGPNQAHGLSFSVDYGVKKPPSLQNIYKELKNDLNIDAPPHGNLEKWAKQGVFLLNSILTVEESKPGSHQNHGWEKFTDAVIKTISDKKENVVFVLWGAYAQKKGAIIDASKHFIIKSVHPSPLSAYNGFFGSKPFSKTNAFLTQHDIKNIDW